MLSRGSSSEAGCPGAGFAEEGTVIRKQLSLSWRTKDAAEPVSELGGCPVLC